LELLRDLWLTTPLTVPTASELSSLGMRFCDGGTRRETKAKRVKKKETERNAVDVSASDVSREDLTKEETDGGEKEEVRGCRSPANSSFDMECC